MLRAFKRDQRLIQTLRLPVSPLATPITFMRGQSIIKSMPAPILRRLICVTSAWADAGRAQQRQAQRLVVRLIRAVLAIGQNRYAKRAAAIREIEPLMRRHLKLSLVVIAAFDRADVPVVRRFRIRGSERKSRLEIGVARLPVDDVTKLDAIARIACRQADNL